jgi:hypothetical protein
MEGAVTCQQTFCSSTSIFGRSSDGDWIRWAPEDVPLNWLYQWKNKSQTEGWR